MIGNLTHIETSEATTEALTIREGTPDDSYTAFRLCEETFLDLNLRLGSGQPTSAADPEALAAMWEKRRALYEHLAHTADQFWIAERDGEAIGYARSIVRDGVQELTEFFVLPGAQSAGVGRALLARAFPANAGVQRRVIIATADLRAQARYLKAGVYPSFPIYYFGRAPEVVGLGANLAFEPISKTSKTLAILGDLDRAIIGHAREADHAWLLTERQGFLYRRNGHVIGYGYIGPSSGPFALRDPNDFPAVLAHAELQAALRGQRHFGVEVPMINRAAVDYLLTRGYRMDALFAFFMSDAPFGRFENYIFTSPPFIM
ncbi:MAG: hypothetical protein Kow00120_24400 [Anaerolineae bacterium]